MKYLASLFLLITINMTYGQVTFTVNNISKDYFGKIFISDTTEVFSQGWVAIFDKKSKKQLIKVEADEITYSLHNGKLLANIKQVPYGEQSQIMYEDYNFDGKKDFAVMDGQNSCYHGPSFQIYLATSNGFKLSAAFTRLAQEYCGMFDLDSKGKRINTRTKSGCCWHQFSEFIVENNKPKAIKIIEESEMNFPFNTYSEEIWNGKKMVKTTKTTINLDEEGIKTIFKFHIEKNGKDIVLFNINDRTLNYAVLDKNNTVEFSYPAETIYQNPDFTYNKKENTVMFQNKNVIYKIYNDPNKVGIQINMEGKLHDWTGNNLTKKGTFKNLLITKLDNVVID